MKRARSLAIALAVTLFGTIGFASTPSKSKHPPAREQTLLKESGYSGWRLKWADVNQVGDRNLCGGLNFYSLNSQIEMGEQAARKLLQTSRLITDPVVVNYVNRVGQNLVRNSDARMPYTFLVVDSNALQAFSLPGGFVFVDSGAILGANNEAELAGVMSHEIAHVAACHTAKQRSKAVLTKIASIPLSILFPYTWAGYAAYQGVNTVVPLAFLKFSREDESQADFLGLEYMYKAGYDPNAFIGFFEKISAEEHRQPDELPGIFSNHPQTDSRIMAIQKEIATILPPRPEYIVDTSDFDRVKQRLREYDSRDRIQIRRNEGPSLKRKIPGGSSNNGPVLQRH